ncbi:MAG: GC-type dockerin domain-anchored protein [Phycisphaerales bacterium JB040]
MSNPSFEVGSLGGWNAFGDVQLRTGEALHGRGDVSIAGPDSGGWAISAVWQPHDAQPGHVFSSVVHVAHDDAEPLTGEARAIVNVEWRDAGGQLISYETREVLAPTDPTGEWHRRELVFGPAPAGTDSARLLLATLQSPAQEPGRAAFDLVEFLRLTNPSYDQAQWDDFPGGRTLDFAGHTWRVKGPIYTGPGPNWFSDSSANAAVVGDDLRLAITGSPGDWSSVEVVLEEPLGYGDYVFTTNSRLDLNAPNVVLGLFLWQYPPCYDEANLWNQHNEFDVEISRWGDPNADLAQFVAQPYNYPGNLNRFAIDYAQNQRVSYAFNWLPDRVECRAWVGGPDDESPASTLHTWTYTGPHLPRPEQPRIHMNLWYFGDGPWDGQPQLALIDDFVFRAPAPPCPADLNGDSVLDNADIGAFVSAFLGQDLLADFNGDGVLDNGDIGAFVEAFLMSC